MELTDTHCHIHFLDYPIDPVVAIKNAEQAGVTRMICVGCTLEDSQLGVSFAAKHDNALASIGLHPHEAHHYVSNGDALEKFMLLVTQPKVVAIGETGLDYFYNHSPRESQLTLLKFQIELALKHDLPLIFHVRDAFDDFWQVLDGYSGLRGVVHSFSATEKELWQILNRGLYVGLNGIMTFTKKSEQIAAAKAVPLDKLLLETDAPFLTPTPYRGTICEPKHVRVTAEFLSKLRGINLDELAVATNRNAAQLFSLEKKS